MVELKVECQAHEVYLHSCHISGDRMIRSGIDGMSRGNQDAGVALGFDIRQCIPLNRNPFELTCSQLEDLCKSWTGEDFSPPLDPKGWFTTGHDASLHVWALPPAAAFVALKEIAKSHQRCRKPERVTPDYGVLFPGTL